MPNVLAPHVLAVVEDLFFTVKIHDAAKRASLPIEFVKSDADALEKAKQAPALILIDLNYSAIDVLHLIEQLKGSPETKTIPVLGYVSHVHGELKQAAHRAGCDMVVARSAFSQNLAQILRRHSSVGS